MREAFGNILIVAGSGRNCGKTSFICSLIKQHQSLELVAIKITPHFHEPTEGLGILIDHSSYRIFKEENRTSEKDSSRYLQAGAVEAYFIQVKDEHLEEAFRYVYSLISKNQAIVIESAALAKFIQPSLFLFIQKENEPVKLSVENILPFADHIVRSNGESFDLNQEQIIFNGRWKIREL